MDSEIEKHKNDLQQLDKYIKMHELMRILGRTPKNRRTYTLQLMA